MKPNKRKQRKLNSKAFIQENFSNQEWESFNPDGNLPSEKSEEMHRFILDRISSKLERKKIVKLRVIRLTRYVAAASIVLMLGYILFLDDKHTDLQKTTTQLAENTIAPTPTASTWQEVENKGSEVLSHLLPDSSLITIYPHSTIKFQRQFNQQLRNVYLTGKAKFKVKRNPQRPFSVYSGAIKTTALGTSFTINTNGRHISVQLHTGKIAIADTLSNRKLAYISTVGTTLLYDSSLQLTKLIKAPKPVATLRGVLKRQGSLVTMKNIPLEKVFGLLNEVYGIRINSDHKDIDKITFTGNVDTAKETPEDILKLICLINNMTLTKVSEEEFIIKISNK